VAFLERESFVRAIQFFVSGPICAEEVLVSGFGVPEVDCEIVARTGRIPEELGTTEMGIALKELDPGAIGPIGFLKAVFTSRLDFELPEDYKHIGPIFCSR